MNTFTRFSFRNWLLAALFVLCCVPRAGAQLLSESFDNSVPPTGWTNVAIHGSGSWKKGISSTSTANAGTPGASIPIVPHSGTGEAYVDNWSINSGNSIGLVTPPLNLQNYNNGYAVLTFWFYRLTPTYTYSGNFDKLNIYVNSSPNMSGSPTYLGQQSPYQVPSAAYNFPATYNNVTPGWYQCTYTIPTSYNSAPAYVIFDDTSNYGYDIYIDDVTVNWVGPCGGTPSAMTITSNPPATAICPGSPFTLSATDPNTGTQLKQIWQTAPSATGPWTDVTTGSGFNSTNYTSLGITDVAYFRVEDSCGAPGAGGGVAPSTNTIMMTATHYALPYQETFNSTASNTVPACYNYNDNYGVNWTTINGIHAADGTTMTAMALNDPAGNAAHGKNNFFTVPGFTLTGSQVYAVRFKYARGKQDAINNVGDAYPEHLQVYATTPAPGFSTTAVTNGTLVFDKTIDFDNVADTTVYFAAPATGSYYFSWYSNTPHPGGDTSTSAGGEVIVDSIYIAPATCVAPNITGQSSVVSACIGSPATLSVTATGTGNIYTWKKGTTVIPGAYLSVYNIPASAYTDTGTYTVTATNPCGTSTSGSIRFIGNTQPSDTLKPSGSTTYCRDAGFSLLAATGVGYTYEWDSSINHIPVPGITAASYSPVVSGTYSVVITTPAGCVAKTNNVDVIVNQPPTAAITPSGPTSFCLGDSVTLIATTGANLTYQWYQNNSPIGAGSGGTAVTYDAKGTNAGGVYKVVVSNGTCSATSTNLTVTANMPPFDTIEYSGTPNICSGNSFSLTAYTTAPGVTYQWQLNGSNINDTSATFSATTAGDYTVIVTSGSCSNVSAPVTLGVIPSPTAYITALTRPIICAGGSIVLSYQGSNGAPGQPSTLTYAWYKDGSPTGVTSAADTITEGGDYTLTVGNSSTNCFTTSPVTPVTVYALPTALTYISGPDTVCAGDSVILVANSGVGYNYQWLSTTQGIIVGATGKYYASTTTDNFKVAITDENGCTDTSAVALPTTINSVPVVHIVNGGDTSFCPGGSVVLSAVPGAGTGLTYRWYIDGINTGVTAASYTSTATGIVTVQATNARGCSILSAPMNTTLNTPPSATIQANGPLTFCGGQSVLLTTGGTSNPGYNYLWKDKAGTVLSTSYSYTATTTDTISVTVTNLTTLCSATTATPVTVKLSPSPVATTAALGATTLCSGNNVTLAADTSSSAGINYQWELNNSILSGATAPTYTTTTGGSYTVVTSNGTCTTTSTPITVTVNPTPLAIITPLNNPVICANSFVTLSATTATGYTYQWKRNNNTLITTGSTSPEFITDTAGSYTLTVTSSQGCAGTSAPTVVTVNPAPSVTLTTINATTACQGDTVKLYASSPNNGLTYTWLANSSAVPTALTSNFGATATGTYNVIVTNTYDCSDTATAIVVNINPAPAPVIAQDGSILITGSFATYQWYFNNKAISGATGSTYNVTELGNYSVFVTDNDCAAMSATYDVTSTTGVSTVAATSPEIRLYPNPTTSMVHIDAPMPVNARISGLDGKMLIQMEHATQVDLSQLANGVYMISLYDDNNVLIKVDRLVKAGS